MRLVTSETKPGKPAGVSFATAKAVELALDARVGKRMTGSKREPASFSWSRSARFCTTLLERR
jgi:hypothetical protein